VSGARRASVLLAAAAAVAAVAAGCATRASGGGEEITAFVGVAVVPMDAERVLPRHTVLVRGDRIVEVGPSARVRVPEGARRIEGAGRWLIPGLAEMHAHVPGPQASAEAVEELMFLYVANGVTTIRGMLGAPSQLELRERLARGALTGPTLIVGAPSLNGTSAPDAATATRLVREHHAAGYDFLKLHPGLTREAYDAVVAAAREAGTTWAGHVSEAVGIDHTLATRQSTIDHLDGYLPAAADPGRRESLVRATREAGTWNVPTAYLWETFLSPDGPDRWLALPEMRYASPAQRAAWVRQKEGMLAQQAAAGLTPEARAAEVRERRALLRALSEGGARILMGTDSPQLFNVPGFALHRELAVMAEAGMTPYAILESGTRNVGLYVAGDLGGDGRFGTVTVGSRADLVLLEADPLADAANVARRAGVMVRGRWIPEEEILRRLAEIEARHRS
jgi:imidazolonepropionase-like amidohydrolase